MLLRRRLERAQAVYHEYPRQFWILILGTFIDHVGGALIFPFFTLYITRKFGVGMTGVGLVFALFSISSVVGSTFGGALTDRLGRKAMLIFGLVTSASATLMMGEMMTAPVSQSLVSRLAPEAMRGRYMAVYGFSWVIPSVVGPTLAGLVMDNADPRWIWYGTFVIGLLAAGMFVTLHRRAAQSFEPAEQVPRMDLLSPEEAPGQV